jgi:hypothetical protein
MNVFLEEYHMHFPDLWQILGSSQIAEVTTLVALALSLLKARPKLAPTTSEKEKNTLDITNATIVRTTNSSPLLKKSSCTTL